LLVTGTIVGLLSFFFVAGLGEATSSVGSRGASVVISMASVVMLTLSAFSRPSCDLVQH
jgi:hypothetical protein